MRKLQRVSLIFVHDILYRCHSIRSFFLPLIFFLGVDQQLEQDSLNFLEWTKTQVSNPHDFLCEQKNKNKTCSVVSSHRSTEAFDNIDEILFFLSSVSDLAPVTTTSGPVAAQAFLKILSLTTKNLVKVVEQDEPYGEVS